MTYAVLKAAGYFLAHLPDMVFDYGTTATTEKVVNPDSEYLKEGPKHLRTYEQVVNYLPNQVYIGNEDPTKLKEVPKPWSDDDKYLEGADSVGKLGDIMTQDEFYGLIKIVDQFELVYLEKEFTAEVREALNSHEMYSEELIARLGEGVDQEKLQKKLDEGAEGLYKKDKLVGTISRAHDVDANLSAHVMAENLVSKASAVASAIELLKKNNINPEDIDYVIECSEEAAGDMNQRGGGSFSKSIAELAGLSNATGSDQRGFCAGPAHSLINASSLVAAGTFKNVMVVAGGSTAKLGMNGKDHVKKGLPILEDVVGGFAALIGENDGVSPIIRNDILGKHTVATGSAPQKVTEALMVAPLERNGLKITDVDAYSTEMQNPDITVPAGAGNVPEANMKMIGALGTMKKHIEKADMMDFIQNHGVEGFAPTQGHIPSGVPYLGFALKNLTEGDMNRVMIVGKGSLFLGRMTNLFDGISFIIERNTGEVSSNEGGSSKEEIKSLIAESLRDFAASLISEEDAE